MEFITDKNNPHLGGNIDDGDSFTFCPKTWDWLLSQYRFKNVLDVGCAQGHALQYFQKQGCNCLGIEGVLYNIKKSSEPIIELDIEKSSLSIFNIDFVWCCEVVEHIQESSLPNLLKLLSCGKVLAMTHAEPGQPGHHHVNCQFKEYWIDLLSSEGMHYNEEATVIAKQQDTHNNHFMWHGLIFTRGT